MVQQRPGRPCAAAAAVPPLASGSRRTAVALLVAVAALLLLQPAAAADQGLCDAGDFQVEGRSGCYVLSCAQHLVAIGRPPRPGTIRNRLVKREGPDPSKPILCCHCSAKAAGGGGGGSGVPDASAGALPQHTRPRPGGCEAGDYAVKQEALCTATRCQQEMEQQGRAPSVGTRIAFKTYAGTEGGACCHCEAEAAGLTKNTCDASDFGVASADECTLQRCADDQEAPNTDQLKSAFYTTSAGSMCCHCQSKNVQELTADESGDTNTPDAPDACSAGDAPVADADACSAAKCGAQLKSAGKDPLKSGGMVRATYTTANGTTCCHCSVKAEEDAEVALATGEAELFSAAASPAAAPGANDTEGAPVDGEGVPARGDGDGTCDAGDSEVAGPEECGRARCATTLQALGELPAGYSGTIIHTPYDAGGVLCCYCQLAETAADAPEPVLVKAVLQLASAPFPMSQEQQDAVLKSLFAVTGATWAYRAQQVATADSTPQLADAGTGGRRLLQDAGAAWWKDGDTSAAPPAGATGVYFFADAAVPAGDAAAVAATLGASSGAELTAEMQQNSVKTTEATVVYSSDGAAPVASDAAAAAGGDAAGGAADASGAAATSGDSTSMSGGAYFGIALACLVGVVAVGGTALYVHRRRSRQSRYQGFAETGLTAVSSREYSDGPRPMGQDFVTSRMQF